MEGIACYARDTLACDDGGRSATPTVVYNPGIFVDPGYYAAADYIVMFENTVVEWHSSYVCSNLVILPEEMRRQSIAIGHSAKDFEDQLEFCTDVAQAGFAGHFAATVTDYSEWCPNWDVYVQHAAELGSGLGSRGSDCTG